MRWRMALAVFFAGERKRELERQTAMQEARERREQMPVHRARSTASACGSPSRPKGGSDLLLKAVLYLEQWSWPPAADIANSAAMSAWEYGVHHKTMGEYAIAEAYKLKGDKERHTYHTRRAEIADPRIFWPSDAFLEHAGVEIKRAKDAIDATRCAFFGLSRSTGLESAISAFASTFGEPHGVRPIAWPMFEAVD